MHFIFNETMSRRSVNKEQFNPPASKDLKKDKLKGKAVKASLSFSDNPISNVSYVKEAHYG